MLNLIFFTLTLFSPLAAKAQGASPDCHGLPTHEQIAAKLRQIVIDGNGGIFKPNAMWVTVLNRSGEVCAVNKVGDAWPGSRLISAQKASTANAFSNDRLALSTANLYSAVQPGGSLYGLQFSNPVDTGAGYKGAAADFGTPNDPLVGVRLGGVNVFGGGLALYAPSSKEVLGGIGVSGDSSCSDHIIAWRLRAAFHLDHLPGGVSPNKDDNIILDFDPKGKSPSGFGHPACSPDSTTIAKGLVISAKAPKAG